MNIVELITFTALLLACLWGATRIAPYLHRNIYVAFTLVLWLFLTLAPAFRRISDLFVGGKEKHPKDGNHQ